MAAKRPFCLICFCICCIIGFVSEEAANHRGALGRNLTKKSKSRAQQNRARKGKQGGTTITIVLEK